MMEQKEVVEVPSVPVVDHGVPGTGKEEMKDAEVMTDNVEHADNNGQSSEKNSKKSDDDLELYLKKEYYVKKDDKGDVKDKSDKKEKGKGRNKSRPPPMKFDRSQRVCPILVDVSEKDEVPECIFPNCVFIHDVKKYVESKPEDIGESCYVYESHGRCPRGVTCRFGKNHIVDGNRNKVDWDKVKDVKLETNHLDNELKNRLRKKDFDFTACDKMVDELFDAYNKNRSEPEAKKVKVEETALNVSYSEKEKKKIDWKDKLYLAPLTTVGNLPFRRLCKKLGADITCGEMAVGLQLLKGHQPEWALTQRHHSEDLFGIQICGGSPQQMARLAQVIEENVDCDFVDINCGCPIDLIYKRGMGCGMMGRKKPLEVTCRAMSKILSVPLTVKMRTGIYMDKKIAHDLIPSVKEWGVDMVTLHGRSREQRYYRLADWEYVAKCEKVAQPMPLFGNGDVMNYQDYYANKEKSGVTGIMFARGALIKPWVFTEVKDRRDWDISASERLDLVKDFSNYGLEHWGSDEKGVETTRRFLLEWLSFQHRYVPQGILERPPQRMNQRIPKYVARNDLETLLASPNCSDWIRISEMFLGKVPEGFAFEPKHRANGYQS